ncbi:MAG: hypothetical protein MHPSP_003866 [Paramarteilia canceri]
MSSVAIQQQAKKEEVAASGAVSAEPVVTAVFSFYSNDHKVLDTGVLSAYINYEFILLQDGSDISKFKASVFLKSIVVLALFSLLSCKAISSGVDKK